MILSRYFLVLISFTISRGVLCAQGQESYNTASKENNLLSSDITNFSSDIRELQSRVNSFQNRLYKKQSDRDYYLPMVNENLIKENQKPEKFEIINENLQLSSQKLSEAYLMPFIGFSKANRLKWKVPSTNSKFDVEQSSGFVAGAEMGYQWDFFFTSLVFHYSQSKLDSIDLGGPTMSFVGKEHLFGGAISEGFSLSLGEKWSISPSVGIGFMFQDYSALLASTFDHNDFDFTTTYNFSTSISFYPKDNLLIGLGYTYMRVGELDFYTSRDLHVLRLSCSLEI